MEAIRNYLETMFLNLPNTPEVYKAKNELWQMMEDKYTELKSEGKSENEAVGIVISEFGNLDELAKDLGIDRIIHENPHPDAMLLPLADVKRYLLDQSKHAFRVAFGILLCIISVCGPILADAFVEMQHGNEDLYEALGVCVMFLLVAAAVGLFIYSHVIISRWDYLKKEHYVTDFSTTEYLHQAMEAYKPSFALLLTCGVILCVLCVLPNIFFDVLAYNNGFWEDFGAALMFLIAAVGVFLIVMGSMKFGSYKSLLHMNEQGTIGGNYVPSQQGEPHYTSKTAEGIMSVFWPTVTCLYLIWSFLTFDWWISWIIWPIAAIINALVKNLMRE